jgi:hypothetical protein
MRKIAVVLVLIVAAIVASVFLLRPGGERVSQPIEGLPWQIETLPNGGSRVFGLALPGSTLADARERLGKDMDLAVVATSGEAGALEAYYGEFVAGVLTGKLILVPAVDPKTVEQLRRNAVKSDYMDSGARKFTLNPDDLPLAWAAPIATVTFIPSANLEEETALKRFGPPAERIRANEHVEHLLYPDKGLDLVLDAKGKEVLQYVAPRDFARLREPLLKQQAENSTAR